MKLTILAENRKRTLPMPFAVCASVSDLTDLRDLLSAAIAAAEINGSTYGWLLEVHESIYLKSTPNTPPEPWSVP